MSAEPLKYLSEARLAELRSNILQNYERYTEGDFLDLAAENGWSIELALKVDLELLKTLSLEGGAESEVKNSLLVWQTLGALSPALATEERIWVRLAHIECLEFSRKRWLAVSSKEARLARIETHFFASTQTQTRDDHAISRLWWNAYIAFLAMPDDHELALSIMLSKADIRSNLIERSRTSSRPQLAAGIVRAVVADPKIADTQSSFRQFMKVLNRTGGGELFEVMPSTDVDYFLRICADRARSELTQ